METSALRRLLPTGHNIRSAATPLAILFASAVLRFWNLGTQSLWFDETYTAFVAQKPPALMMRYIITDGVHPPTFYWIMALWIRVFGDTPWVLRFPSAIAGILSVGMLYLLVKKMAGKAEATLAAFLLGVSPFFVWYSQDARMYAMDCLAAILAVFFFWEFIQKPSWKNFAGMILAHAIFYGLHYFGVFLLLTEACFLILFRTKYGARWKLFLLAQTASVLPLVWWIAILFQRANGSFGIGWIPKPSGMDPILTVVNFFFANSGVWTLPAILGAGVLVILLFLSVFNPEKREAWWFGLFWLALPILIPWILSRNVPVYIDRYFIFTLPAAVLLVSIGAQKNPWPAKLVLPGLLMVFMLGAVWNLHVPTDGFHKEQWREAAEYIRGEYRPDDIILLRVFQITVPLDYYGLLDLRWKALEINQELKLSEIQPPEGKCLLLYWVPSQSVHSFGTDIPSVYTETDGLIREWVQTNCRGVESRKLFHGILVIADNRTP